MSENRTKVVPVANCRVRDPNTGAVLPPEGLEVVVDGYWRRRVAAGDVRLELIGADIGTKERASKRSGGDA